MTESLSLDIEKLVADLQALTGRKVQVNITEVMNPDTDAQLVAEAIERRLEEDGYVPIKSKK